MKRLLVLVSLLLVLMSISLCAHAELGMNLEMDMVYLGEWTKEDDTYL